MKRHVQIQSEDFDIAAELDGLTCGSTDAGAVACFIGRVRREGDLSALTLEHYPRMTEAEIVRLVQDAEKRWPLLAVTVLHRVGRLEPGARIVLVAVASAHRRAAFEACEFLIDYLKTRPPSGRRKAAAASSIG
jgi:molybdopterin synthase catalytic subunit